MRRLRIVAIVLAALLVGCGSSHGPIRISARGGIGPLHVDTSDRADVVSFAGKPESELHGKYDGYGAYDALGYRCAGKPAADREGYPACATVFYVDVASGALEEFFTKERRYVGPGGVRTGMSAADAERRLHRRVPKVGCIPTLTTGDSKGGLTIAFDNFRGAAGNKIEFFVAMSARRAAGVFDCIDS
jgi:hypothetical protein